MYMLKNDFNFDNFIESLFNDWLRDIKIIEKEHKGSTIWPEWNEAGINTMDPDLVELCGVEEMIITPHRHKC